MPRSIHPSQNKDVDGTLPPPVLLPAPQFSDAVEKSSASVPSNDAKSADDAMDTSYQWFYEGRNGK